MPGRFRDFRDERIYGVTAERKLYGRSARRANDRAFITEGIDEMLDDNEGDA
jgi:hypothetical protein